MLIPILILAGVLILIPIFLYNGLIGKKNRLKSAESSIDIMFKKRHDLIPNLIETVKRYMQHEAGTLTEITKLRQALISNNGLSAGEKNKLENQLSSQISGLRLTVENYPDLKANTNFLQLQRSLNEVEEQLSAARRSYNASAVNYNNSLQMFPSNLMANMMKLEIATYYDVPDHEKTNPNVGNLFDA